MNWPRFNPRPRQTVLAILAGLAALCALGTENFLVPAWNQLAAQRATAKRQSLEYEKLTRHLAVADLVAAEFQRWGTPALQNDTDEVTLAGLLRTLEAKARIPGMAIVNIKPLPVSDEKVYKLYRVRLSLAGKLPDLLGYVGEITAGGDATGIESFSLRGTPRPGVVECSLSLRTVRLVAGQGGHSPLPDTAPSTKEVEHRGQ